MSHCSQMNYVPLYRHIGSTQIQLITKHGRVCDVSTLTLATSVLFIYLFLEPIKIPTYDHIPILTNAVAKVFLPVCAYSIHAVRKCWWTRRTHTKTLCFGHSHYSCIDDDKNEQNTTNIKNDKKSSKQFVCLTRDEQHCVLFYCFISIWCHIEFNTSIFYNRIKRILPTYWNMYKCYDSFALSGSHAAQTSQ